MVNILKICRERSNQKRYFKPQFQSLLWEYIQRCHRFWVSTVSPSPVLKSFLSNKWKDTERCINSFKSLGNSLMYSYWKALSVLLSAWLTISGHSITREKTLHCLTLYTRFCCFLNWVYASYRSWNSNGNIYQRSY